MSTHAKVDNMPSAKGMTIVIVQADFNADITHNMVMHCRQQLHTSGAIVHHHQVAGALEIPIALQWSYNAYQPEGMVAFGCVIRGETYHFEIVAQQSAQALIQLSHSLSVGIANGILTCEDEEQAKERQWPVAAHCAKVAVQLAHLKAELSFAKR